MTENLSQVVSGGSAAAEPAAKPGYRAHAACRAGRLPDYVQVEAGGDAEAVALTRILAAFYPIELWQGARFLGRFEPSDESGAGVPPAQPEAIRRASSDR